jgi:hypothetical protein
MIADDLIASFSPYTEKHFFNKVAGASHRNSDRTSRKRIIGECDPGDELELVPEPNNKFDANAVAVCNQNGEQLGFLEARTAKEVSRDILKERRRWFCYLAHHNLHPETEKVVGATLLLFCLSKESAASGFALEEQKRVQEADKEQRLKVVQAARESRIAATAREVGAQVLLRGTIEEPPPVLGFWKRLKKRIFVQAR